MCELLPVKYCISNYQEKYDETVLFSVNNLLYHHINSVYVSYVHMYIYIKVSFIPHSLVG